jgi:malonyl-CoA/methylmalonyl-CoA synthetase
MNATSIIAAFLAHATNTPDRACLRFEDQILTYGELRRAALTWSARLAAHGLHPGERLALYLGNGTSFLAIYLGAQLAGAAVVLVNTQYRQVELRHILNDSGARLVVTDEPGRFAVGDLRDAGELPELHDVIAVHGTALDLYDYAGLADTFTPCLPQPEDLALLGYTSGTTGRSKGAMLTHGNLAANSAAVTQAWHWTEADTLLLALPLFHIHGLGVGFHGTLLSGADAELHRRFDAATVCERIGSGEMTMFFGVPTMYTRLLAEARRREEAGRPVDARGMRLFVSGSAPLDPQTFAEFEQRFSHRILERYGMTETVMNLTNPYDGERRPGTVGQPFPGQEARIVDVKSRRPLPPGEVGEIQVRGPHVCRGYWQRPEATAEVFAADGWFSTGDMGLVSADGYFTIAGRARELIISGGYNIYPREVEEVLLSHPAVAEAAVVGMPDADLGEQVVAAIVPAAGSSQNAEELIEYCRSQLAAYKKPRQVIFVEALPRNALGKVQKHILQQQLAGG